MRILFLTNLLPYPTDNGGKIKTYNMLKILSSFNEIDLISFYENDNERGYEKELLKYCDNVYTFDKKLTTSKNISYMIKNAFKSIFSSLPFGVYKYNDERVKNKVQELTSKNNYDIIYFDHLQLAVYSKFIKRGDYKFILDQHNCEHVIMKRYFLKEKNILKKAFLLMEYKKLQAFEAKMLNLVDKIVVLSKEDMKVMQAISKTNKDKYFNLPIVIENNFTKKIKDKAEDSIKLLFLGTLTWFPNHQGIMWFLDKVMPKLDKNIKLYIVGKDPSSELIKEAEKFSNVVVTGYVDDVNFYVDICDVMVVPIFIGSGMRVKILEGLAKSIPIVSTTIGAEGIAITNRKDIVIADNEDDFVTGISELKNIEFYNEIARNGKQLFQETYSFNALKEYVKNELMFF